MSFIILLAREGNYISKATGSKKPVKQQITWFFILEFDYNGEEYVQFDKEILIFLVFPAISSELRKWYFYSENTV